MEKAHVSPNPKPNEFFNQLLAQWARGESMPSIKRPVVWDVERARELDAIAKRLVTLLELTLDEKVKRNIMINAEILDAKTLRLEITKTNGSFNALLHGQVYDPKISALIDIRGDNVSGRWGVKITVFTVKMVDKKLLLSRLFEILKRVIELEGAYA